MTAEGPAIDLNCDLGEGAGHDAELMPLVSSANVAAGAHAGGGDVLVATVRLATTCGVAVGAHPGHADRAHFGRRERPLTPEEAATVIDEQIVAVARAAGSALHHVKLHGGLYHQVSRDPTLAGRVASMLASRWPRLVVYAAAGSALVAAARAVGLMVAEEAFPDRQYAADGTLVPRSRADAVIDATAEVAARAVRLATAGRVASIDGRDIVVPADTLCIHGDAPRAVAVAHAVRAALVAAGVRIRVPDGRAWET